MKINEDDPLPRHTEYDWEECYAKVVLEHFIKEKVGELQIIDRPDLQSKQMDVGIECTLAIDKRNQEIENLYCELTNNKSRNPEKCKERIEKLGGKVTEYTLIQSGSDTPDNILKAIKEKLKKLNGGNYRIFKKNNLLIRDWIHLPNERIKSLQYSIGIIQSKFDREFDVIYILLNNKLIELNMYDYTYQYFEISSALQYELAEMARDIVVKKEEEKDN